MIICHIPAHLTLNPDVSSIMNMAAHNSYVFGKRQVIPEAIFLACFEKVYADPNMERVFDEILNLLTVTPEVSQWLPLYTNIDLNGNYDRVLIAALQTCLAVSLEVNPNTLKSRSRSTANGTFQLTPESLAIMERAQEYARNENCSSIDAFNVLSALFERKTNPAAHIDKAFATLGVNNGRAGMIGAITKESKRRGEERLGFPETARQSNQPVDFMQAKAEKAKGGNSKRLDKYTTDLTELARQGKIRPCIGREFEVGQAITILCKVDNNNPVLLGEAGVGKTTIAEAIAQRIADGNVPDQLKDKKVLLLDVTALTAGTRFRGDFEENMKHVLDDVRKLGNVILFVDEAHNLAHAGSSVESGNALQIIKSPLSRGELTVILATTVSEYRSTLEKDDAFKRRIGPVWIRKLADADIVEIMKGVQHIYAEGHSVTFDEDVFEAVLKGARKCGTGNSPSKEIGFLDTIGVKASFEKLQTVNVDFALRVISEETGIPADKLTGDEQNTLSSVEGAIRGNIIGQDEVITDFMDGVARKTVIHKKETAKKPILSTLFLGPSGVGKTEFCKQFASAFFGSQENLIRLDMSEYMEKHSISKLTGAPPGYIGHDDNGNTLVEQVIRKPYSVVLFDEIEKAHSDVLNLLLQILWEGELKDSKGRIGSFKNTIIVLTSNLGSNVKEKPKLGFGGSDTATVIADRKERFMQAARDHFRPEQLGRLDSIHVFNQLTPEDCLGIVSIKLGETTRCIEEDYDITIRCGEGVLEQIAKASVSDAYGARNVASHIERNIENLLAKHIMNGLAKSGDTIIIEALDGDSYSIATMAPDLLSNP